MYGVCTTGSDGNIQNTLGYMCLRTVFCDRGGVPLLRNQPTISNQPTTQANPTACIYIFNLSRRYAISSIYIVAVGNTLIGKRHISRTKLVNPLQSILEVDSLHTWQSPWYHCKINSTHSSTRKNASETGTTRTLRRVEKCTSYRATDVV